MSGKKFALLSVSDKQGLAAFAERLVRVGYQLMSTGGTYNALSEAKIPATDVQSITDFPEIMGGRVKTLHPRIHGGILARAALDLEVLQTHNIPLIDLVVVNLYPFRATIAKPDCTFEQAIEQIDIGGPAMIRAAAKNQTRVTVVVDSGDYDQIAETLESSNQIPEPLRRRLAAKAFAHTADYDAAIYEYLSRSAPSDQKELNPFPEHWAQPFKKTNTARYGENPHQAAAFYQSLGQLKPGNLASAQLIQGKALSYNNMVDADAALAAVKAFEAPACVIVKHANPCGAAVRSTLHDAYLSAHATDPTSAFGGIIAVNQTLDANTAAAMIAKQFVEVIIAPQVDPEAVALLTQKPNCRVLTVGDWTQAQATAPITELKSISGGLLIQTTDTRLVTESDLTLVTQITPTAEQIQDLLFAFKIAKYVKSNAIVYAKDQRTLGIGAGQMSRVYSAKIAGIKANDEGLSIQDSVMASDAFFPFRDTVDNAAAAGIKAIIQPGGSKQDRAVIEAANEHEIAMVFTGVRHFRH